MKQNFLFLVLAPLSISLMNCSDDDDSNWGIVPTEVRNAFEEKYPDAKYPEWENKGNYKVAEFFSNNLEMSAWFASNGIWYMTETDISFELLPQTVKDAFQASEYNTWRIDDVDKLERKDTEVVYIIEVESQNKEIDLFYSAEGILIKAVADNDNNEGNHIPQSTPAEVESFIKEKYPQSRIIEIEYENRRIEVDIVHDQKGKEVVFDENNQWLYTSWDIRIASLPQVVANILNDSKYAGYHIDDANFVETPQGNYYLLELEKANSEINVKVAENGVVIV